MAMETIYLPQTYEIIHKPMDPRFDTRYPFTESIKFRHVERARHVALSHS